MSHASRIKISVTLLNDKNRIREDYSHVEALAESIRDHGLIQPIVCTSDYTVVDGGSRLRACRDYLKWTEVDVVFMETMSEAELRVLEVEANIRRKDFTWQERVMAVVRVHELKTSSAALMGDKWGQRQTGELLGVSLGSINNCLIIASLIRAKDKDIMAASNVTEAVKLVAKRKEAEATKLLAAATLSGVATIVPSTKPVPSAEIDTEFFGTAEVSIAAQSIGDEMPEGVDLTAAPAVVGTPPAPGSIIIPLTRMLLKGDCLEHMKVIEPETIDHVITDIPYGIDMDYLNQDNKGIKDIGDVEAEHTIEGNVSLMTSMFLPVFRILKPGGFFVFFYDLAHHEKLLAAGKAAGFRMQRWPLVWHKTHTCLNQFASKNFTKNFEVAMVCSKGNATLVQPQHSSVWSGSNEDIKTVLQHPFAKPLKLWSWVMTAVALKGQTIYDPFAGVGSSTIAAIENGYKPIASELNDEHYNRLVVNISQRYANKLGSQNVIFQ